MKRTSLILVAFAGLLLAGEESASGAGFMYFKDSPIVGESTRGGHGGWIEVDSYQWVAGGPSLGPRKPGATASGGPGTLRFVRRAGPSSLQLKQAFDSKTRTARVEFEFPDRYHPTAHYLVQLSNVLISGYSKSDPAIPTETISLNFDKITWKHVEQGAPGSLKAAPAVTK